MSKSIFKIFSNNSAEASVVKITNNKTVIININFREGRKKHEKMAISNNRLTWENFENILNFLVEQIKSKSGENFNYDLLISVGRSGAVVGAMLSDRLPGIISNDKSGRQIEGKNMINIPHYSVERYYDWTDGQNRNVVDTGDKYITFNAENLRDKNILLVGGHAVHGGTIKSF